MNKNSKIYVAGHTGLIGSALIRKLKVFSFSNVITRTRKALDLTDRKKVKSFFSKERPEYVILAAAKVGGIYANNTYPADFIYTNLIIEANVIHAAYINNVKRLLFLGSSCIYPRLAEQPMAEDALLTSGLEPTNEPYAIAKISGIKLCESYNRQYGTDFRSIMPTNLYGINDNFHPENSHVIPALMRRFHDAKINNLPEVIVWGTGNSRREFLDVDDMADASIFLLKLDKSVYFSNTKAMLSHINVGTGVDITINEMTKIMLKVVGYKGKVQFDSTRPDGAPRKLLDTGLLNHMGWRHSTSLEDGLVKTYDWYKKSRKILDF